MADEDRLHSYLNRVADGDASVMQDALSLFRDSIVYLPIFPPEEGSSDQVRIRPATFEYNGGRYVPIFTSEFFLEEWGESSYASLPIYGADLASVLPHNLTVLVNPGSRGTVELSLEHLRAIFQSPPPQVQDEYAEMPLCPPEPEPEDPAEIAASVLPSILSQFEEVLEGYYLPPSRIHPGGVLAVVTTEFDPSRRFKLVTQLGELSKRSFGSFGALEFLDDVGGKRAPYWGSFASVKPLYVQERRAEPERKKKPKGLSGIFKLRG